MFAQVSRPDCTVIKERHGSYVISMAFYDVRSDLRIFHDEAGDVTDVAFDCPSTHHIDATIRNAQIALNWVIYKIKEEQS